MAVASWTQNTAIALGVIRRATAINNNGLFFKCTTAGTTGATQPEWPKQVGDTITDGTVVWTAISSTYEDVSELSPNAIIELFELRPVQTLHNTSTPIRWHNGCNANVTGNIVFNGQTYTRMAIEADGFTQTTTGSAPRPTLTVANTDHLITFLLRDINEFNLGNDLGGAEVRRIRTHKKFLDGESTADPYAIHPLEVWLIDRKSSENMGVVQFELAMEADLPNTFLPKRQLIGNCCQWKYRSSECSYTGNNYFNKDDVPVNTLAADVCGKKLSSCKKRFGENGVLPFGSFPTAGKTR